MAARTYAQYCGVARALDRLGDRWTLLLVRELLLGPRRFTDLESRHPGLAPNLLSARLKEMTADGLVGKESDGRWALTPTGAALEPVIMELGRWGSQFMGDPLPGDRLDVGWAMLSLQRRFRPGWRGQAEIRVLDRVFCLDAGDRLTVRERAAPHPDVVITADVPALRAWLAGRAPGRGSLGIAGEDTAWNGLVASIDGVR